MLFVAKKSFSLLRDHHPLYANRSRSFFQTVGYYKFKMEVLQLTATQFIKPMSTGRNRPLLLGCEDSAANPFEVVVKFRGKEMDAKAQIRSEERRVGKECRS